MSLRRFLNVAYAILVEEYQRMGVDLITALEKIGDLGEGVKDYAPRPAVQASSNEASMQALQGMLKGVQGAPARKPRRA